MTPQLREAVCDGIHGGTTLPRAGCECLAKARMLKKGSATFLGFRFFEGFGSGLGGLFGFKVRGLVFAFNRAVLRVGR